MISHISWNNRSWTMSDKKQSLRRRSFELPAPSWRNWNASAAQLLLLLLPPDRPGHTIQFLQQRLHLGILHSIGTHILMHKDMAPHSTHSPLLFKPPLHTRRHLWLAPALIAATPRQRRRRLHHTHPLTQLLLHPLRHLRHQHRVIIAQRHPPSLYSCQRVRLPRSGQLDWNPLPQPRQGSLSRQRS